MFSSLPLIEIGLNLDMIFTGRDDFCYVMLYKKHKDFREAFMWCLCRPNTLK